MTARFAVLALFSVLLFACDKGKSDDDKKKKDDDDDPVAAYCDKMIKLDAATAKANGVKDDDGPPPGAMRATCKMIFNRAKKEEPKAWACFSDCMMEAKTRIGEQECLVAKDCIAKAKNKKLLGNQVD